jgi:hypothetical protein
MSKTPRTTMSYSVQKWCNTVPYCSWLQIAQLCKGGRDKFLQWCKKCNQRPVARGCTRLHEIALWLFADVVGHSYGGLVVTEAALVEYSKVARAGKGLEGGVIHILYLCAVLLQPGQTPSALSIEGITDPGKVTIDVCTSALFYGSSL